MLTRASVAATVQATDLHRHHIDHVTIPSQRGPEHVLKRCEEVRHNSSDTCRTATPAWLHASWPLWLTR